MTHTPRPTTEELERALLLADDENENSISSGKNFNSGGWSKMILAAECGHLQNELKAMATKYTDLEFELKETVDALAKTKRLASYHSHHEILEGNCQTCYLQDAARELDHAGMDALNAELAKTKQEFERFAERAVLDATRKDQEIENPQNKRWSILSVIGQTLRTILRDNGINRKKWARHLLGDGQLIEWDSGYLIIPIQNTPHRNLYTPKWARNKRVRLVAEILE